MTKYLIQSVGGQNHVEILVKAMTTIFCMTVWHSISWRRFLNINENNMDRIVYEQIWDSVSRMSKSYLNNSERNEDHIIYEEIWDLINRRTYSFLNNRESNVDPILYDQIWLSMSKSYLNNTESIKDVIVCLKY